jgi:hypothetical protein
MQRRRVLQAASILPLLRWVARAESADAPPAPSALGYLPWWMAPGWQAIAWNRLDRLVLFDAPVGSDGSVLLRDWPQRAPALNAGAARSGAGVDLALTLLKADEFDLLFRDRGATPMSRSAAQEARESPFTDAGFPLAYRCSLYSVPSVDAATTFSVRPSSNPVSSAFRWRSM